MKNENLAKTKHNKRSYSANMNLPEYMVSYRSSLSYLKDLHNQTQKIPEYRLIIKIPKLFTEELIYKNQDKTELY